VQFNFYFTLISIFFLKKIPCFTLLLEPIFLVYKPVDVDNFCSKKRSGHKVFKNLIMGTGNKSRNNYFLRGANHTIKLKSQ
jgi:hypothetical protein